MRRLPVAVLQTLAHDRATFAQAWPRVRAQLERACERGARLAVLPEGTIPGYVLGPQPVAPSEIAAALDDVAACAKRFGTTIVCGAARTDAGAAYNVALAIGPDGRDLGWAAKRFLWHFDRHWFAPGTSLDPIDTPVGRLGLLVCADGRIPTIAATLVERGAEVLVMPTAWVTSGRDPAALENVQADLLAAVRARENGVPFLAANKAGVELASVAYCGKSAIFGTDGATLARAGERGEATLWAELSLGAPPAPGTAPLVALPDPVAAAGRARFAITPAGPAELATLEPLARQADADAVLSPADAACGPAGRTFERGGVTWCAVPPAVAAAPRGLVAARLGGVDAFLWEAAQDDAWSVPLARGRAVELRAYVVVFAGPERAFAVDPDGAIVAGTFEGYRIAAFAYDRARALATTVAPGTDVLAGLRAAEAIRGSVPEAPLRA